MNNGHAAAEGSYPEWDRTWGVLPGPQRQLYTSGKPASLLEFWQRCYFEDLWAAMGAAAPGARYLELGSGRGTTSMYLAARGCDVTMVDLSENALRLARENFAREELPCPTMMQADVRDTRLARGFDCVFSIGLLEHFADPVPVLIEGLRLLSRGGLLFQIIAPHRSDAVKWLVRSVFCPWRAARFTAGAAARAGLKLAAAPGSTGMLRTAYTRSDYARWVRDLGAREVRCVPYNAYHPVYRREWLDRRLVLPIYRFHHRLKTELHRYPALRTLAAVGACDLLLCRRA